MARIGRPAAAPKERPRSSVLRLPKGLAAGRRGLERLLGPALLVSFALFLAGLFLPAVSIRQFYFFRRDYSLFDGLILLFDERSYFLLAIVCVFTILFPALKILTALAIWYLAPPDGPWAGRLLHWLAVASKWSMLDVFIIAVTVVAIDERLLGEARIDTGILFFAAAVLLSTYAVRRLDALMVREIA